MGEERRKAVDEELKKWKEARLISEIKYPTWLADVVLVKKSKGKWRMCVDYTDLCNNPFFARFILLFIYVCLYIYSSRDIIIIAIPFSGLC